METSLNFDPAKLAISSGLVTILNTLGIEISVEECFKSLEKPPESKLGDYALPCFKFAKQLKLAPPVIAAEIKQKIESAQIAYIAQVNIQGAFLNFFTNKAHVAAELLPQIKNGTYFNVLKDQKNAQTRVMIEYSQPNTHKEFHVGHGRNVCLGDSVCRLFTYNGYQVIPVNYIGDEGAHIAKCLWGMEQYKGQAINDQTANKAEWLGQRYVEANNLLKDADEATKIKYQAEISAILRALESKSGKYYETWLTTKKYCMDDFHKIYHWLDVKFDHFFYESEVSEASQKIVEEYIQKGLFVEDQGAIGFDMSDKKLGFFMARKSDGTTLYITKDLALARVKFNDFKIDRSIYVVASEQNFHFKQLFYCLEKMGFKQASQCYHLSYGMVVRPDGKMSSRAGNSFTFFQLIEIVQNEINLFLEKYKNEWSQELIQDTAQKLTVGAIKYGMLQADTNKEIVFDPKEWVSFEGNSGPYLMYAYARTKSILKKAADQNCVPTFQHFELLTHEAEHELLRYLYDFNQTIRYACENYKPSTVCHYLFDMCKAFNRFYVEVPIMKAESEQLKSVRLALIESFAMTLFNGLNVLGITPPERM